MRLTPTFILADILRVPLADGKVDRSAKHPLSAMHPARPTDEPVVARTCLGRPKAIYADSNSIARRIDHFKNKKIKKIKKRLLFHARERLGVIEEEDESFPYVRRCVENRLLHFALPCVAAGTGG